MLVSQILRTKGDTVFTIAPTETIAAVAALLHSRRVGALVVLDAERVVGIVSERDVVRALAEGGAAALGEALHRRPGEVEDLRGGGRGRRAEGLYRGELSHGAGA